MTINGIRSRLKAERDNIGCGFKRFSIQLRRSFYLKSVDTVSTLQKRNRDFNGLREKIRQSGTDSLDVFNNSYTHEGDYFLQQNPDEFAALCSFLKEKQPHKNYLEIGSASGGACLFIYQQVGFTNGLSLDDGKHERATSQTKHFDQIENFQQFIGDSHSTEARKFLEANANGKLDIAFIDGDHSYQGVCQDISLVLRFSQAGTLLIFHDTVACEPVERAWIECVQRKIIKPLAEYIGVEKPLGIAVGEVI